MTRRTVLAGIGAAAALFALPFAEAEAQFPEQPITFLVGYGPGGMTDTSTRIITAKVEEILGVDVIVENVPGAGGTLALAAAQDAPADGYTVTSFLSDGPVASVFLGRDIDLDDWEIIGSYMPQERVLFSRKDVGLDTFEDFLAYAKETPVTFADGGAFWAARVVEAMGKKADLKLRMVPFLSGAEGSAAILGGHVTLAETGVGTSAWHAATDGTLNILADLGSRDLAAFGFEDVKNLKELGFDYTTNVLYGYAMKAGSPPEAVEAIGAAIEEALADPEVNAQLTEIDLTPEWMPGDQYREELEAIFPQAEELKAYLEG